MACTTMDESGGWEFFFKYKMKGPLVLWKLVMAIGGGPAAAMAIVNMAFNSHGSCSPSTKSHDHPNYVLCPPLSLPMRKFDEPSFAALSSGRASAHQCTNVDGWCTDGLYLFRPSLSLG
jgi:hypothetical protein